MDIIVSENRTNTIKELLADSSSVVTFISDSDVRELAKSLIANGKTVYIFSPEDIVHSTPSTIVAIGTERTILSARNSAHTHKLILAPNAPYMSCVRQSAIAPHNNSCLINDKQTVAIIIQKDQIPNYQLELFNLLFGTFADINDAIDKTSSTACNLSLMRKKVFDALLNHTYDEESIRTFFYSNVALNNANIKSVYTALLQLGMSQIKTSNLQYFEFFTAYVINLLLLHFTNAHIKGIIIGNDRVRLRSIIHTIMPAMVSSRHVIPIVPNKANIVRDELLAVALKYRHLSGYIDRQVSFDCVANLILELAEKVLIEGRLAQMAYSGIISELLRTSYASE
ncbi:MAG: hypothetical protein LBE09_06875 [Christensenellaceae bacterium]|jgi:hypothetical protein|nr:hypothetical protein [Christensenellaceae bacterium]